ncbi:hypothetical protein BH10BAC5_BH10BAC5_24780 [soil metagenome]
MITIGISRSDSKFQNYINWLEAADISYRIFDWEKSGDVEMLSECSGLILTGGSDIYPEVYCDWDTPDMKGKYLPERDGYELNLLSKALDLKMPVFGICRGLQLINVYFRGSLIFDIEDIRKVNHRKIAENTDRMHLINIFPDTLLSEIMKESKVEVNSSHHQAADRTGEGLMINCRSEDGIVEGLEYADKKEKSFLIAVQFHPERFPERIADTPKKLLDRFVKECYNYAKRI